MATVGCTLVKLRASMYSQIDRAYKCLRRRVEEPVAAHLESEGLQFIQFAFRWVNCLLLREVPFPLAVRLWDTYLAEG